jgi:hypothetical protein
MSDDSSTLILPALQQAPLDAATVAALFRDLAACTRIVSVTPRRAGAAPRADAQPTTITLGAAQAGLADGTIRGVQIRYFYDHQTWCDTLMARPDGIRLVRISESDIAATLATPADASLP